jgi:hypothetical protein
MLPSAAAQRVAAVGETHVGDFAQQAVGDRGRDQVRRACSLAGVTCITVPSVGDQVVDASHVAQHLVGRARRCR